MFKAMILLVVISASGEKSSATGTFPNQFVGRGACQTFVDGKIANAETFLPEGARYEMLEIWCQRDTKGLGA